MIGTTWQVDRVVRVIDGDSLRVVRSRMVQLGDDWFHIRDADPFDGLPVRLAWVDTPERGRPGYTEARDDLQTWISEHRTPNAIGGGLLLVCLYRDPFGRLLADLTDAEGNSASQWLMAARGWPPYEAKP